MSTTLPVEIKPSPYHYLKQRQRGEITSLSKRVPRQPRLYKYLMAPSDTHAFASFANARLNASDPSHTPSFCTVFSSVFGSPKQPSISDQPFTYYL
jgi:hypothetical protein